MKNGNNDNYDSSDNNDSGSVWTSYSDLFTTVAIIFLVMFVFALIKAGVSSMKIVASKKESEKILDGKIPKKMKENSKKRKKILANSIHEMSKFGDVINDKLIELNTLSGKIKDHKQIIKKFVHDQEIQQVAIGSLEEQVIQKDTAIQKTQEELEKVKELLENNEKVIAKNEFEKKKMEGNFSILKNKIAKLQNQYEARKLAAIELEKSKEVEIQELRETLKEVTIAKQKKEKELEKVNQAYSQDSTQLTTVLEKEKDLRSKISQKLKENEEITKKVQGANQKLQELLENKTKLAIELSKEEIKSTKLQDEKRDLKAEIAKLKEMVKEKEYEKLAVKSKFENEKIVNGKLEEELSSVKKINNDLGQQVDEVGKINAGLGGQIKGFSAEAENLNKLVKGLEKQKENLTEELKKIAAAKESLEKENQKEKDEKTLLKEKLVKAENEKKLENDELKKKIQELERGQDQLVQQLASLKNEKNNLAKEHDQVLAKNDQMQAENKELHNMLNNEKEEIEKCLAEKSHNEKSFVSCRDKVGKISRGIASARDKIRSNIGQSIADRLKKANVNVKIDPRTGSIILQMDESFLFADNSSRLSESAKKKLQAIIPIYAEELFENKNIADKILNVNFIGHASPTYGRKFVDPKSPAYKAYSYNLKLSSERASQIVEYIFGSEFIDFKHSIELRKKVLAIGNSFTLPIKGEGKSNDCGIYDCKLSRRVEISFTLKDDDKIIKALSNIE